jgi:hypothetical protein
MFLLIIGGLFSQIYEELYFDTEVSGIVDRERWERWYSIRPSQTGMVVVETEIGENTDTVLLLQAYEDITYNVIDRNYHGSTGENDRLEIVVQAGRTYHIRVNAWNGRYGPYSIRASQIPIPRAEELKLGDLGDRLVSGNLGVYEDNWYKVQVSQPGFLAVETWGDTNTVLEVYDESYSLICSDDNSGVGWNARLKVFANEDETFFIRVRSKGKRSGPYHILADIEKTPNVEELRFDTIVSGHLQGEPPGGRWEDEYWYSVRALQDGFLTVETGGYTNTILEAYDSLYKFIKKDNGSKDGKNSRVEIFAEAGITYYFKLRGNWSRIIVPYNIWASSRPIPPETELRPDSILTGNIRSREVYWYSVRPAESGYITVGTTGISTYLEAYDLSNKLLGANDNGGEGSNAILEIPVEAGKTYMFKLRGDDANVEGLYSIRASFDRSRSSGYRYR